MDGKKGKKGAKRSKQRKKLEPENEQKEVISPPIEIQPIQQSRKRSKPTTQKTLEVGKGTVSTNIEPVSKKPPKKKKKREGTQPENEKEIQHIDIENQSWKEFLEIIEVLRQPSQTTFTHVIPGTSTVLQLIKCDEGKSKCFEYEKELAMMMHSFGDAATPEVESVHLMEILAHIFVKNVLEGLVRIQNRSH
jgi:hypothetical protein